MDTTFLIPVIAILATFGAPVAIIYVIKHFRLKERELNLEAGVDANERYQKLEGRLDRIERALVSLHADVKQLPAASSPAQLPPAKPDERG